jgi:hypothetical protein
MTTAKEDEEAIKATLATMIETMAMAIVAKAKTTDETPTTSISPASYMEGDTVQKIVMYSNGKLANNSHLAEISKTNNEIVTATTSPISTIASRTPIERSSLACLSTTLRLLVQVLIHPLGYNNALITLFKGCTITATSINGLCPTMLSVAHETPASPPSKNSKFPLQTAHSSLQSQSTMYSTSGNQPLSSPML